MHATKQHWGFLHVPWSISYHLLVSTSTTGHILDQSWHFCSYNVEWTPKFHLPTGFCYSGAGLCLGVFRSVGLEEHCSLCHLRIIKETTYHFVVYTEWCAYIQLSLLLASNHAFQLTVVYAKYSLSAKLLCSYSIIINISNIIQWNITQGGASL